MKKTILFLLALALLLPGCNNSSNNNQDSTNTDTGGNSGGDTGGDDDGDTSRFEFDSRLLGQWYIYSSTYGVVGINIPFVVNSNQTVSFDGQIFTCTGYYENFVGAYQFVYGSHLLILSYDESSDEEELDWGYFYNQNGDLGVALRRENDSGKYNYIGENWPIELVNDALDTTGNIPAINSDEYYLKIFNSALYNCTSAAIEIKNTSIDAMSNYISGLISDGYIFSNFDATSVTSDYFYLGYDESKIYSLRIIYFSNTSEINIFIYKYNDAITPEAKKI